MMENRLSKSNKYSKRSRNAMRLSIINSIAIALLFVAFLILK